MGTQKYIDSETSKINIKKIKSFGCNSIHIGGGEPFLNIEGLFKFAEIAIKEKMNIDYVETNASWYKDEASAINILKYFYLVSTFFIMHNIFLLRNSSA